MEIWLIKFDGCEKYEETQEHVLHCEEISKMQTNNTENIEILYEKVMNGKFEDQVEIVKQFMKKMEILDKIRRNKSWWKTMLFAQE